MKHIEFYVNHNTKRCSATFGEPFKFDGPLMNLPATKDGKMTHVLGLTPYTVEQVIAIPFDLRNEASQIIYWYDNDVNRMIEKLKVLQVN
jgi:hypothetical protein